MTAGGGTRVRSEATAPAKDDRAGGTPFTREEFDAYQRLTEARGAAAAKINATTLPAPAKAKLVARFNGLARFTEADVDNEIKAERDYVVRMAEALGGDAGKVKLNAGDIQVEDRSVRVAHMLWTATGSPEPSVTEPMRTCRVGFLFMRPFILADGA